jgi:hypothetical protein
MNTAELSPGHAYTAENKKSRPSAESALIQVYNTSRVLEIQAAMQVSAPETWTLFNKVSNVAK